MFIYLLLFLSCTLSAVPQLDLSYLVRYAGSLPENPEQNLEKNRSGIGKVVHRVVDILGVTKASLFSVADFQSILQEVLEKRSIQYMQGRLVQKFTSQADEVYVVWGELNGAFHSLVRDLVELCKQGRMSKDLMISDATYYIFNGDVIGHGAYSLETFMLVLYLMLKNPKKVIYIKGSYEDKDRWAGSLFGRKLEKWSSTFWSNKNEQKFQQQLRLFFNSLPLALYVMPFDQVDFPRKKTVRISCYPPDYAELDEASFSYFFDTYTPPVISLLDKNKSPSVDYQVAVYMYAQNNTAEYAPSEGLLLKAKNNGATYWTTIASPILEFRKQYQFFNDAFVTIATAESFDAWTIALNFQDVRKKSGFTKSNQYYLLTGDPVDDPLQKKIRQLEYKLHELKRIKQQLYQDCLSDDLRVSEENEDPLTFVKRWNWQQLLAYR